MNIRLQPTPWIFKMHYDWCMLKTDTDACWAIFLNIVRNLDSFTQLEQNNIYTHLEICKKNKTKKNNTLWCLTFIERFFRLFFLDFTVYPQAKRHIIFILVFIIYLDRYFMQKHFLPSKSLYKCIPFSYEIFFEKIFLYRI